MRIPELHWLYENQEQLQKEEVEKLNEFDFFHQYKSGELNQNAMKMVELFEVAIEIHKKYN